MSEHSSAQPHDSSDQGAPTEQTIGDTIGAFLAGDRFAVVGASTNRDKYGNKVLRAYMQHGREAHPINPRATVIEGLQAYPSLASLSEALGEPVDGVSIITPPAITEQVVDDAIKAGVKRLWMQPGAESEDAVATAERAGLEVIAGGACLLVVLGYNDRWIPAG